MALVVAWWWELGGCLFPAKVVTECRQNSNADGPGVRHCGVHNAASMFVHCMFAQGTGGPRGSWGATLAASHLSRASGAMLHLDQQRARPVAVVCSKAHGQLHCIFSAASVYTFMDGIHLRAVSELHLPGIQQDALHCS